MPAYFISKERAANGGPVKGTFWRSRQGYGCIGVHTNLHLLAYAVGDTLPPRAPAGSQFVGPQPYCLSFAAGGTTGEPVCDFEIALPPWAVQDARGIRPLPIGPRLSAFLDDPLGSGERMNLALPFSDPNVELTGGWVRDRGDDDDPDGAFHGGFDFRDDSESPRVLFPVVAAADGVVKRASNGGVCLLHTTALGKQFYTIYRHLDDATLQVKVNENVRVGQTLGKIGRWNADWGDNSHLHFVVAVKRASFTLGAATIPEIWFAIDPFGVYDYHRDDGAASTYTPTRPGGFEFAVRGRAHTLQFRQDPLIRSFPAELETGYHPVVDLQTRVRSSFDPGQGSWPAELDALIVHLDGVEGVFRLPLLNLRDANAERQLIALLRTAQAEGKWVRLGYRWVDGQRMISAAWVRH